MAILDADRFQRGVVCASGLLHLGIVMQLALRRTNSATLFGKLFNICTRWRLHTDYPHSGIVIDGMLYHTTFSDGLHESMFNPEGWELFDVDGSDAYARSVFNARKGAKYDAISLLAFILPWRVRDSRRLYCYEWCWLVMTGENPKTRITPERLLTKTKAKNGNSSV